MSASDNSWYSSSPVAGLNNGDLLLGRRCEVEDIDGNVLVGSMAASNWYEGRLRVVVLLTNGTTRIHEITDLKFIE